MAEPTDDEAIEDIDLPQVPFLARQAIDELSSGVEPNKTIEEFDSAVQQEPFPERYQELVSEKVADKLLEVFKLSTLGILAAGGVLLLFILNRYHTPQDLEAIVDKGIVPFLRGAATFATTVFGPLLAFILGFYFGKNNEATGSGRSTKGKDIKE